MIVTLQGNRNQMASIQGEFCLNRSPSLNGELGKFSLKMPKFKAPKIKFKALKLKMPKLKMKIKMPKMKFKVPGIKIKGPNFSKFAKGLTSPFEQIGSSLTNLGTGLIDQVGSTATGVLDSAGQAIQEQAPQLLKAGLTALDPTGGVLSSMLGPGMGDLTPGGDDQQQLQQDTDSIFRPQATDRGSNTAQAIQDAITSAQTQDESPLMKYLPWALGAGAVLFVIMQNQSSGKGRRR